MEREADFVRRRVVEHCGGYGRAEPRGASRREFAPEEAVVARPSALHRFPPLRLPRLADTLAGNADYERIF